MQITIPANGWRPRPYQLAGWTALEAGVKRVQLVWPRRHGKDDVGLHWSSVQANQRAGNYWYMLPLATQARKAIWDAINPHTGLRRIDEVFPKALRETTREQEMFIKLKSGASWQVLGSDNYDSFVGSPPVGVVFSEWALCDPRAWAYVRPILLENDGWSLFNGTPRGRNHHATMYEAYMGDPDWFVEKLTADETKLFTQKQLENEKRELMLEYGPDLGEALYRQEYMCSFDAPILGAYYAKTLERADADGRVANVPHDPAHKVHTAWDLGKRDATAIWFYQIVAGQPRFIDYYEATGAELDHYARELADRRYMYGKHVLPHDAQAQILGMAETREEQLRKLLVGEIEIAPQLSVADGINAARVMIEKSWFDRRRCSVGLNALRHYHAKWDEKKKVLGVGPEHDWASHGSDALRYAAISFKAEWGKLPKQRDYRTKRPEPSASWVTW